MKKKMFRGSIVLFLLFILLGLIRINVYADDQDPCTNESLNSRFELVSSFNSDNTLKVEIKLSPTDISKYGDIKFDFDSIKNVSGTATILKSGDYSCKPSDCKVSGNSPVTFTFTSSALETLKSKQNFSIFYKYASDSLKISNSTTCDNKTKYIELNTVHVGFGRTATIEEDDASLRNDWETAVTNGSLIKCDNTADLNALSKDEFKHELCRVKLEASKTQSNVTKNSNYNYTMKCNKSDIYIKPNDKDEETKKKNEQAYYTNTKNFYASSEAYIKNSSGSTVLEKYTYTYYPGATPADGASLKCKRHCEEAIEVKYGPPVASKAGLCFEYKIKVISRTNCYTKPEIPKPSPPSVCTPYPSCNHNGSKYRTAGPNDNFDDCVKECDGGKYTKSCSQKCYNKIYGKSNKTSSDLSFVNATKLAGNDIKYNCEYGGCYYADSSGTIFWRENTADSTMGSYILVSNLGNCIDEKNSKNEWRCTGYYNSDGIGYSFVNYVAGRWYRYNKVWGEGNDYIVAQNDGFFRAYYNNNYSNYCTDDCSWKGCNPSTQYLNKTNKDEDEKNNKDKYYRAIAACKAAATCTTKTGVQTVAFNINPDKKVYSEETISYDSDGYETRSRTNGSMLFTDSYDYDNKYTEAKTSALGCFEYEKTSSSIKKSKDRYRAAWGFPGTWINMKDGKAKYTYQDSAGYYEVKNKYCLPLDTKNVNVSWWNKYVHEYLQKKKSDPNIASIDFAEYDKQCSSASTDSIENPKDFSNISVDWNIHAYTKRFGFFSWTFNIDCFYATNTCLDGYKIRTVDRRNLFPDEGGADITAPETVGRDPGFNWTDKSSVKKNEDYPINPDKYIQKVQKNAWDNKDALYNDIYLDYLFELSPNDLSKIRSNFESSRKSYINYKENATTEVDSIFRYESDLVNKYAKKQPAGVALYCNDIKDDKSHSSCEK